VSVDLDFDDAQQAIAAAVGAFCRERCSDALVRAARECGELPHEQWRELAALGVLAAATPEGEGGALEVCAAVEALGWVAFPGPIAESLCATQVLPEAERVAVAEGRSLPCIATDGLAAWAPVADLFLLAEGERLFRAHPRGAVEALPSLGGEPWGRVDLERGKLLRDAERGLLFYDLSVAAYLAAAGRRIVAEAAAHARSRSQFGRAIGEFQAVAHPLADCFVHCEAASALARAAAWEADEGSAGARAGAAAARLSARGAALEAVHVGHQVFGAVGIALEGPVFHVSRAVRQLASAPLGADAAAERVLVEFQSAQGARP
jgi:alkylation response protein AidB-like acyl-CoA dehydrogenase